MLDGLIDRSIFVIREALPNFQRPAVLWSTGKDSTTLLHLVRRAFFGEIPIPVVHIDTGCKFREVYDFRSRLAEEWGFKLIVAENLNTTANFKQDRFDCCHQRKTLALKEAIIPKKVTVFSKNQPFLSSRLQGFPHRRV